MTKIKNKILIDGREIFLMPPDNLSVNWIGQEKIQMQLEASWLNIASTKRDKENIDAEQYDNDIPMNPVIVGPPGYGKTSLIAFVASKLKQPLYIFQCTMDTRPEDLVITPVLTDQNKIRYQASSLVSAMVNGGVCILDEGNRMKEKSWASLAPLLDSRRYVESVIAGVKIHANPKFRIASTMNEDSSTYQLPEYIRSRLKPRLKIPRHSEDDIRQVIECNLPFVNEDVVNEVVKFMVDASDKEHLYSARIAIQIADLSNKYLTYYLSKNEKATVKEVVKEGVNDIIGHGALKLREDW